MPSGRPWYQRNPADFIMGTRDLTLEERGAYSELIDHLNERDRPLPDDDRFIAGLLCCPVQRWKKIRAVLIAKHKIVLTPDGQFTNERFEREHASRFRAREEAVENGRAGGLISAAKRAGQTELDLEPDSRARTESTETSNKVATKLKESSNLVGTSSKLPHPKTKQNQRSSPTPPPSTVRARESRVKRRDSSHPNSGTGPTHAGAPARESGPKPGPLDKPPGLTDQTPVQTAASAASVALLDPVAPDNGSKGRLESRDLRSLYAAVCDASGFCPTTPTAIDRAMTQVEKWREAGIDFDEVVLPVIRAAMIASDEPTRVLSRFNLAVRHEHAKRKATAMNGTTYRPPEIPHLNPEGEDPAFLPLRTELLERLGERTFALYLNHVTFEDCGHCQGDKHPLRILGGDYMTNTLRHGDLKRIVLAAARIHGFTDLW